MRLGLNHFVVSSVLVHAAVFAVWTSTQSPMRLIASNPASAPSFAVMLQDAAKPTKRTQSKSHQPRRTHSNPKPQPQLATTTQAEPESTPAEIVQPQHSIASAHAAEIRRNEIRARVLSRIRSHLHQYFIYPLLAQREGWQGRVLLGFSVEANGKIRNIHVAAGSGYSILDTSAVAALSRVPYLYEASNWLQGERLDLQMPVVFHLQGG